MSRNWKPESQVSVTDAGMVIKIKLNGVRLGNLTTTYEQDQLCIRGRHDNFGLFEIKFDIPPDCNESKLAVTVAKGILRIELPAGKTPSIFSDFPKNMLIYCNGCGKHFDIVINDAGPNSYACPACGKAQIFDFKALIDQVMQQAKNLSSKKRGRL